MSGHELVEVFIFLLLAIGLGLWLIWKGFKLRKQREYIEETPTADVGSVSIGPAELTGFAEVLDDTVTAPFSDEECLVAAWEVEEWEQTDDGAYWNTIDEGADFVDFALDDGTGTITVDPTRDAEFVVERGHEETITVGVDETPPDNVAQFLDRHDTPGPSSNALSAIDFGKNEGDRRYRQNLLEPGDEAYVYGAVRRADSSDGAGQLVVGPPTKDVDAGMFMISDQREETLLDKRNWALAWRLPAGALLAAGGVGGLVFFFF